MRTEFPEVGTQVRRRIAVHPNGREMPKVGSQDRELALERTVGLLLGRWKKQRPTVFVLENCRSQLEV